MAEFPPAFWYSLTDFMTIYDSMISGTLSRTGMRLEHKSILNRVKQYTSYSIIIVGGDFIMTIGKKILILRINREWTQATLAEKLNVSSDTVQKWEAEKTHRHLLH